MSLFSRYAGRMAAVGLLSLAAAGVCGFGAGESMTQAQSVSRAENEAFRSIDRNGDGVLTGLEAEVMLPFDSDGDSRVTREEFGAALGMVRSRGIRHAADSTTASSERLTSGTTARATTETLVRKHSGEDRATTAVLRTDSATSGTSESQKSI